MKKSKYLLFALMAVALATCAMIGTLVATELYLHKRYENLVGLNIRGYRGKIVGRKQPGEKRIVVLGGSTAFGYGTRSYEAFPFYLQQKLTQRRQKNNQGPVSVANLAYNNQGAFSFLYTLQDYDYLNYDAALFYEGYNDTQLNTYICSRHNDLLFRLTGYQMLLPMILREKAMSIRFNGKMDEAYWSARGVAPKTIFHPNLAQRTSADAIEMAANIADSLQTQLGHRYAREKQQEQESIPPVEGFEGEWGHYCYWVERAVDYTLKHGKKAIVVTQPYISDRHVQQQDALVAMLQKYFKGNPNLLYVNLGHCIDIHDTTLVFDGVHLVAAGNEKIADGLVDPILELLNK